MPRIDPLPDSELAPDEAAMARQAEALMGFTPNDVLTMARVDGLVPAMAAMVGAIYRPGAVPMELKRLVALMRSAAAGCQYCTAHTGHGVAMAGIDPDKLVDVWTYADSDRYSAAEKAALAVAVAAGQTPNAVTDAQFAELRRHFSDEQVQEIVAVIGLFAFLNAWNHTLATELEASPLRYAEQHLAERGWSASIHAPTG